MQKVSFPGKIRLSENKKGRHQIWVYISRCGRRAYNNFIYSGFCDFDIL